MPSGVDPLLPLLADSSGSSPPHLAPIASGRSSVPTLRDLQPTFLAEYRPRLRRPITDPGLRERERRRYLGAWRSDIAHVHRQGLAEVPLPEITRIAVERLRDGLIDGGLAGATAAKAIGALAVVWTWWAEGCGHAGVSPCKGVHRPRSPERTEYLEKAQVPALYERCRKYGPPALLPMVATALNTGLRKGELLGLTWPQVHLEGRRLDVVASYDGPTKGGKPRSVGLNQDLLPLLRDWQHRCPPSPGNWVFPVPDYHCAGRWTSWSAWRGPWRMGGRHQLLGLRELLPPRPGGGPWSAPWHLLRHSFASHYVMRRGRGSLYALQRILGHSSITTTMRYAHLAPDYLAEGMEDLGLGLDGAPPEPEEEDEAEHVRLLRKEVRRLKRQVEVERRAQDRLRWRLEEAEAGTDRTCSEGWSKWHAWASAWAFALQDLAERGPEADQQPAWVILAAFGQVYDQSGAPPSLRQVACLLGLHEMAVARWARQRGLPAPPAGGGPRLRGDGAPGASAKTGPRQRA